MTGLPATAILLTLFLPTENSKKMILFVNCVSERKFDVKSWERKYQNGLYLAVS